jgi:hypothetical protein
VPRITVGNAPNQAVILEERSDAISVILAESSPFPVSWHLEIWAQTPAGDHFVGEVDTVPATVLTQFNDGLVPSPIVVGRNPLGARLVRAVASAYQPGAIKWMIEARSNPLPVGDTPIIQTVAFAELTVAGETRPGSPHKTGVLPVVRRAFVDPPAGLPLQQAQLVSTLPVFFRRIVGSNEANGRRWVMLFDTASALGGGQPIYSIGVPATSRFDFELDDGFGELDGMRLFTHGLFWAESTTAGTLTLPAPNVNDIIANLMLGV